jgi:hypothetical protein
MEMTKLYMIAKCAKVGEFIQCPACGRRFIKKTYNQIFCTNAKTKIRNNCKDRYWNNIDPKKRCNTTRISPASAAWMERQRENRESDYRSVYDSFHPLEGLNDEDYKNH